MAERNAVTAKQLTSSAVVTTANKTGLLWGVTVLVTAANVVTVDLINGGSGGTTLWSISVPATAQESKSISFTRPIIFSTDIYCTITGSNAVVSIAYEEIED